MKIISLRQCPDELERFVDFFSRHWGMRELYRNCMTASLSTKAPLPQWYLLVEEDNRIVGGAGLVSNDFISRSARSLSKTNSGGTPMVRF